MKPLFTLDGARQAAHSKVSKRDIQTMPAFIAACREMGVEPSKPNAGAALNGLGSWKHHPVHNAIIQLGLVRAGKLKAA